MAAFSSISEIILTDGKKNCVIEKRGLKEDVVTKIENVYYSSLEV